MSTKTKSIAGVAVLGLADIIIPLPKDRERNNNRGADRLGQGERSMHYGGHQKGGPRIEPAHLHPKVCQKQESSSILPHGF